MDYIKHIETSLDYGKLEVSKLKMDILNIDGISSNKVRCFLNNICNIDDINYLELGVFRGSTFCSAVYGNNINAIAIDNWSSPFLKPNKIAHKLQFYYQQNVSNPKEEFVNNVKKFGDVGRTKVFNANYLDFDYTTIAPFDIVFYDGETKTYDQYTALKKIIPSMSNTAILIMDDWNWNKESIYKAIEESDMNIIYEKNIYTNGEDLNDFWNGLGIFLLERF